MNNLKNNTEKEEKVPESTYKYLLTIARRNGTANIRARILLTSGGSVALVKKSDGRGNYYFLPHCNIDNEADGKDMEEAIKNAVLDTGLDVSCVNRYLGSKVYVNGTEKVKCFDFEVAVKDKKNRRDILWIKKSDISGLSISGEEKRILTGYFRK